MHDYSSALVSQMFQFEGRSVRTSLASNGEPLFVAKDVCEILGLAKRLQPRPTRGNDGSD